MKFSLVLVLSLAASTARAGDDFDRPAAYRELYAPFLGQGNDLMSKVVDNRGNGYEPLYGLRNFRVVLHGVMYRGGANNAFHRDGARDNSNPLPRDGIENLCREGFGKAIYLYSKNFQPVETSCTDRFGRDNSFTYEQVSPLGSTAATKAILRRVHECIEGKGPCPIYTHCWNGWHASGFISAVALRQFCGFSGEQAVRYWIDGTDYPTNHDYPTIKESIRRFEPLAEFAISAEARERICPRSPYTVQ